jgi:formylglycine-generating enzyme required for sulfatase activity
MELSKVTTEKYLAFSKAQLSALKQVVGAHARGFHFDVDDRGILAVDRVFQFRFRLVPGGTHRVGLTSEEEAAARRIADPFPATIDEMRPVVSVTTKPLLISESPVTNRLANQAINHKCPDSDSFLPAALRKKEADHIAKAVGCRLLSEAEWETAIRGGEHTLFVFGNILPPERRLKTWMNWDLLQPMSHPANRLGLIGLYFGEWCSDKFKVNYSADATVDDHAYVVRGGGAYFWPWQDEEWVWCMSAMRMPSSALPSDGCCSVRLAYDLC